MRGEGTPPPVSMPSLSGQRLVIFGCGYVGSAVAQAALAAGARVEALTRNPEKAAALRAGGLAKVAIADLASAGWHDQIEGGADYVVNCVSAGGGPDGYQRSYVDGMKSILAWAARSSRPVGTMVYTSSTSVYAQGGGATVGEADPAEGGTPNGKIIRQSELLLEAVNAAAVRRWFILRLAGIYGPGRHHLLDQLREGRAALNGSGDHRLNLIHRDDIVSAMLACLRAPSAVGSQIFNVADDAPATRAEVVDWLAAQLGRPAPSFDRVPGARRGGEPMPDRIIGNARIKHVLDWRPHYADYRDGFGEILKK